MNTFEITGTVIKNPHSFKPYRNKRVSLQIPEGLIYVFLQQEVSVGSISAVLRNKFHQGHQVKVQGVVLPDANSVSGIKLMVKSAEPVSE